MLRLTIRISLRNGSLGDFIIVRTSQGTYTSLDSIVYCTPRLYRVAYCSQATNLHSITEIFRQLQHGVSLY